MNCENPGIKRNGGEISLQIFVTATKWVQLARYYTCSSIRKGWPARRTEEMAMAQNVDKWKKLKSVGITGGRGLRNNVE